MPISPSGYEDTVRKGIGRHTMLIASVFGRACTGALSILRGILLGGAVHIRRHVCGQKARGDGEFLGVKSPNT